MDPWYSFSVKQKILISLWVTTLLLLALSGVLASFWFIQDQEQRLEEFLVTEVTSAKETLLAFRSASGRDSEPSGSLNSQETREFLERYFRARLNRPLPYKTTLGVFDSQGNLVGSSNNALSLVTTVVPSEEVSLEKRSGPPPYRLAVLTLEQGRPLGSIRMACVTVTLAEVWESFLLSMVLVLVLVFVSFGLLGTGLILWSLRPVREMCRSAQSISEAHLNLRLVAPPGNDEISTMAKTLNHLLARLERDHEFEETLLSQLTHELRTPLAILRGRNELALERLAPELEPLQPLLEDNLADIDAIVTLLNTLLNLARLDGRIDAIVKTRCDLSVLLRDLLEELAPLWDAKGLGFALTLPGGAAHWDSCPVLSVEGDPVLLKQVFSNILTNAFKYTPRSGQISVSVDEHGIGELSAWRVVIHNPGPPLPEEALDLVFRRFYRVEVQDPDRFERESGLGQRGFGLGLSIAKSLVDLHQGAIRAFNPASGGVSFEVLLPRPEVVTSKGRAAPSPK